MKPEGSARRRPAKYRQLPHTADLAWRIRGGTLPELFENAAGALVATMTDRRYIRRLEKREIAVESPDREALLVDWLNRLLYLFDVAGFLGREFQVTALTDRRLQATAWGERSIRSATRRRRRSRPPPITTWRSCPGGTAGRPR